MKSQDVILQLYSALPSKTDKFTTDISVTGITVSGPTATATTSVAHGLVDGDLVTIQGALAPINIASMDRVGTVVTVVTTENHDLTEGYQETVVIDEANEAEFNGTFTLLTVPNRKTFTFETVDSGATSSTGSPVLLNGSAFGFNGLYTASNVTATTFDYTLLGDVAGDARGTIIVSVGYRISGAISLERALEAYTRQSTDDWWIFVVLGDVTASKDRHVLNDSISTQTGNTQWQQLIIQPFTILTIAPATATIGARNLRDDAEDIASALFGSLLGVKFDGGLSTKDQYQTVFSSHGSIEYDTAIYVHQYNFESSTDITFDDTVGEGFNVAFRDLGLTIGTDLMTDNTERLTVDVDLDDQPLS